MDNLSSIAHPSHYLEQSPDTAITDEYTDLASPAQTTLDAQEFDYVAGGAGSESTIAAPSL